MVLPIARYQNAPGKRLINSRATNNDRNIQSARLQGFNNELHLLAGGYQERAQANRVCFFFNRTLNNDLNRHLFTQVNHAIAIVLQNCFHQIFANIVNVAKHGCQHNFALAKSDVLVQIRFQDGNRLFHDLCRLQDERQNQFALSKGIPYFLHRWQ